MESNNSNSKTAELIDTEDRLVVLRGRGSEVREMGEGSKNVETSRYKINKSWD